MTDKMQAYFLQGSNAKYFFFPNAEDTVIRRSQTSIIYIGAEVSTKQKVIVKQFNPELFDNQTAKLKFFVEASISLKHKGIIKTIDLVVENENIFIIQEFIMGQSLKTILTSKRYLNYKYNYFFIKVIAKCCEALNYLHQNGFCHCDIKPDNIMVVQNYSELDIQNPEIKIIDLASIKPIFKDRIFTSEKKTYNVMYGSPEQVLGFDRLVGQHSDIFSLGLVLYETIAKQPALDVSNPMFIKRLQVFVDVPSHYRIDEDLFDVIKKATVKPNLIKETSKYTPKEISFKIAEALQNRYQNCIEMQKDLLSLIK